MLTKIMLKLQQRAGALSDAWQAEHRRISEQLVELLRFTRLRLNPRAFIESFHRFSSHLSFGSHGVLRTNEPDEQKKAVIYTELVANAVVL